MSQSTAKVSELLQTANEEGDLSDRSLMVLNVPDVGMQIQAALGVQVGNVDNQEVVLFAVEPDDSGSIAQYGNTQEVCDGHNLMLDALGESKQRENILICTRYLNGSLLNDWRLLVNAERMSSSNYDPTLGTPLYDNTVVLLGSVIAKAAEAKQNGQVARTVTVLVTDGADLHSRRFSAADVASLVGDMLAQETHIIAAIAINDGHTSTKQVFLDMGIPEKWILSVGNSPKEIRKAFLLASSSAVRASQGAASFSQTAVGGFGS